MKKLVISMVCLIIVTAALGDRCPDVHDLMIKQPDGTYKLNSQIPGWKILSGSSDAIDSNEIFKGAGWTRAPIGMPYEKPMHVTCEYSFPNSANPIYLVSESGGPTGDGSYVYCQWFTNHGNWQPGPGSDCSRNVFTATYACQANGDVSSCEWHL